MGTLEAGAESRRLPQCQQEVERLWARENHGINGIWAKSRQTVPSCYSALLPEQSGTDKERKSQPDLAFNPDFLVKWLKMFSSWRLWGAEAIRGQDTCGRPSSLAGNPQHGHREKTYFYGLNLCPRFFTAVPEMLEAGCACPKPGGEIAEMGKVAPPSGKHLKEGREE